MQLLAHQSTARFRVIAFGRQAGKSTWGVNELVRHAWERPRTEYWFLSPIYSQAEVQFERMLDAFEESGIFRNVNKGKLTVTLINKSKITFKSGETLHRLRGNTLHGVIVDEVRDQHPDLWKQVLRPMLATTKGWAAFISTPKGYDQFFDLYERARLDSTGRWVHFKAPSTCNPLFSKEELEDAKKDCTQAEYEQEYLAEFRDLQSGRAYVSYSHANESFTSPFVEAPHLVSPHIPIVVALDFNLSPMSWTLGQISPQLKKAYFFDEIHLERSHTQEAALELVERVRSHKAGVILIGDATGKAGQRAAAGQSDYDILTQILDLNQIKWVNQTPDSNPLVVDRVNTTNTRLKSASGDVAMTIHPVKCKYLKNDYERVVWKSRGTLDEGTKKELTHQSDGVGYALCVMLPVQRTTEVGKMRVINR